ncbi:hypothetical protein PO124_21270 [Bacillus licheniformis]|nr:hypothetical protein [Bacillus licheniformis]
MVPIYPPISPIQWQTPRPDCRFIGGMIASTGGAGFWAASYPVFGGTDHYGLSHALKKCLSHLKD